MIHRAAGCITLASLNPFIIDMANGAAAAVEKKNSNNDILFESQVHESSQGPCNSQQVQLLRPSIFPS